MNEITIQDLSNEINNAYVVRNACQREIVKQDLRIKYLSTLFYFSRDGIVPPIDRRIFTDFQALENFVAPYVEQREKDIQNKRNGR